MSRNLLILALLASGTGCSATRPLLSTIVVTPPRLSFRQLPLAEDSWHWNSVAVTYPSESLIPAPCTPSPVRPAEIVAFFEEEYRPVLESENGTVPSAVSVVPVPPDNVDATDLPAIVYLKDATSPQPVALSIPSVEPVPFGITPIVQAAVAVTYPSGSLVPAPCTPSPVRPAEMAAFFEELERPELRPENRPVPSATAVAHAPPDNVDATDLPAIVYLKDTTSLQSVDLLVSSVAVSTGIAPIVQTASMSTLPSPPVRVESPSVLVQPDFSELLTEIRNQRKLIEALQRELTRERSADDAAIDELEAVVENLLVQTKTTPSDLPITLRK